MPFAEVRDQILEWCGERDISDRTRYGNQKTECIVIGSYKIAELGEKIFFDGKRWICDRPENCYAEGFISDYTVEDLLGGMKVETTVQVDKLFFTSGGLDTLRGFDVDMTIFKENRAWFDNGLNNA